jgi:hypothetical protein
MRTLPLSLAGAAVALLLVVAAPALSARPYRPAPVEFDMTVAADGARAAGAGGRVLLRPLRAPKRFNLVGLRWRGSGEPAVALRVRREGGVWSDWTPVDTDSDHGPDPGTGEPEAAGVSGPVWAGRADFVQYRSSRPLRGLRLEFVNTLGDATAADRARTAVRAAASRAALAVAGALGQAVPSAGAGAPQPGMVTRDEWGATENCVPRGPAAYGEVRAGFVHHTAGANTYSPEQGPSVVLAICQYHRNTRGWNDIGYNFLVDRYGKLYEGRAGGVDRAVVGAHTQGFNGQAFAVSNIGSFDGVSQTDEAMTAMARLIRWKLGVHGQPLGGTATLTSGGGGSNRWPAGTSVQMRRISGHRDGNTTACPGSALYAQLPELRRRVEGVASDEGPLRLTLSRLPSRIVAGASIRPRGRVSPPKPRVWIAIARRSNGRYRSYRSLRASASSGRFARSVRLWRTGTYRVRVKFAGDGVHRATTSDPAFVRVTRNRRGGVPARR